MYIFDKKHYVENQIIYSELNKWFMVQIPKNASTTIHVFLKSLTPKVAKTLDIKILSSTLDIYHNKPKSIVKEFPELKYFTRLCIVRNPWDRCLSYYTFRLKQSARRKSYQTHSRLIREGFKNSWMPGGFFSDHLSMNCSSQPNGRDWLCSDTQSSWCDKKTKHFKLEDGLDKLYNYIGVDNDIQKKHNTKKIYNISKHYDYQDYYDKELKDRIVKLYKKDIDNFGYTF